VAINNKIQVVYRLSDRITLMWPVRPNASNLTTPESYNVYWDSSSSGGFSKLLGSVQNGPNIQPEAFGIRSYYKKVVLNVVPSLIPGWNNDITNYIKMKAVISGAEQAFEGPIVIAPYTANGLMRLQYPELRTTAVVGWNDAEKRFIPTAVDTSGKLVTTT